MSKKNLLGALLAIGVPVLELQRRLCDRFRGTKP